MSLLTRMRARAGAGLARTRIGTAVVVHEADGVTKEARALAETLPADPEHDLVVADLPTVSPVEVWTAFASALPKGRRPVRVVPGREPREVAPYVWQWIADRTGRPLLAPYGMAHHLPGAVFVHSDEQSGWASYRRGMAPTWAGKRFPRPAWDTAELGQHRTAGFRGVAEPLPAGVWLRPDVGDGVLAAGRAKLMRTLPCLPEAPVIVLGAPDAPDLELTDVAAFWRTLPPPVAAAARFVRFGGVALPPGTALGQELADTLDVPEIWCYTGVPAGPPDAVEVLALREDGSLGWNTYAQAIAYRPRGTGPTRVCAYRPPVPGLSEIAPGVYWHSPDAVVEVVQAGLWIRPPDQPADPAGVRATPLDPANTLLLHEATDPTRTPRLKEIAETVATHLDKTTRPTTRLMPTTALSDTPLTSISRSGAGEANPSRQTAPTSAEPASTEPASVEPAQPASSLADAATFAVRGPAAPVSGSVSAVQPLADAASSLAGSLPAASAPPAPAKPPTAPAVSAFAAPGVSVESGRVPVASVQPPPATTPPAVQAPPRHQPETRTPDETDLPWLSRLMETVSMPSPVRPSPMERTDDRAAN